MTHGYLVRQVERVLRAIQRGVTSLQLVLVAHHGNANDRVEVVVVVRVEPVPEARVLLGFVSFGLMEAEQEALTVAVVSIVVRPVLVDLAPCERQGGARLGICDATVDHGSMQVGHLDLLTQGHDDEASVVEVLEHVLAPLEAGHYGVVAGRFLVTKRSSP